MLTNAIKSATNAIDRFEGDQRRRDKAVCLLFRAVQEMGGDEDYAFEMAERLLGFTQLKRAE
jgi:hypothetical protein